MINTDNAFILQLIELSTTLNEDNGKLAIKEKKTEDGRNVATAPDLS